MPMRCLPTAVFLAALILLAGVFVAPFPEIETLTGSLVFVSALLISLASFILFSERFARKQRSWALATLGVTGFAWLLWIVIRY
jgi:hypothetical protein